MWFLEDIFLIFSCSEKNEFLKKGISNRFPHHREVYSLVLLYDIEISKQKVTNNLTNKNKKKTKSKRILSPGSLGMNQ